VYQYLNSPTDWTTTAHAVNDGIGLRVSPTADKMLPRGSHAFYDSKLWNTDGLALAHAVHGLKDLEKSVTQTAVRDELTYTSNKGGYVLRRLRYQE
jgi:hypothetical protein